MHYVQFVLGPLGDTRSPKVRAWYCHSSGSPCARYLFLRVSRSHLHPKIGTLHVAAILLGYGTRHKCLTREGPKEWMEKDPHLGCAGMCCSQLFGSACIDTNPLAGQRPQHLLETSHPPRHGQPWTVGEWSRRLSITVKVKTTTGGQAGWLPWCHSPITRRIARVQARNAARTHPRLGKSGTARTTTRFDPAPSHREPDLGWETRNVKTVDCMVQATSAAG